MKARFLPRLLALILPALLAHGAETQLRVVSTLADFASIAQAVGGPLLETTSLAKGSEDAHFVEPRPSFIRALNRADVLLHGGAELEIGWLPPLLNNARNSKILAGQPGNVVMCERIPLLEVPTVPVDRSQGDVHPLGNPHFWLDPVNGGIMADHLARAFGRLDPAHAAVYATNATAYRLRLDQSIAAWTNALRPFRGTRVLTYHKTYEYLAHRFGFEIVGQLEPKPGIEPSPTHLNHLIPLARAAGVKLILIEPFRAHRVADRVAEQIGAKVVVLPEKVGATDQVPDYPALFDNAVKTLIAALQ